MSICQLANAFNREYLNANINQDIKQIPGKHTIFVYFINETFVRRDNEHFWQASKTILYFHQCELLTALYGGPQGTIPETLLKPFKSRQE